MNINPAFGLQSGYPQKDGKSKRQRDAEATRDDPNATPADKEKAQKIIDTEIDTRDEDYTKKLNAYWIHVNQRGQNINNPQPTSFQQNS